MLAAINGLELFGHERGNIEVFKTLRDSGATLLIGVNARSGGGQVGAELEALGFETFQLPFGPQWSKAFVRRIPSLVWRNPLSVATCSEVFLRAAKRFQPTHVHLGSPLTYSYVSLALAWSRLPLIYRMGDCAPIGSWINHMIWRAAVTRASRIVAISAFVRRSAIAGGAAAERVRVLYNKAPSSVLRKADGAVVPREKDRLVYVGAISKHKGLMELIDAISLASTTRPSLTLDVLGGSMWDSGFAMILRDLVDGKGLSDRVSFHGFVDDPSPFYRSAALHVVPTMSDEPLGNVVMEAKREGTPSIVFPSGGLPEMIRHEADGYICSERTPAALAKGILWMLDDAARLDRMGSAAQVDYLQRFGPEQFAVQWDEVYLGIDGSQPMG